MPVLCSYSMKIVGNRDDCMEFINRLKSYESPRHFWRFFSADIYDEDEDLSGKTSIYVNGDCAWSIASCGRASGYSNGTDLFALNTKELNLDVEVYSREASLCFFEEYYLYKHGVCTTEAIKLIDAFYWDREKYKTYADYKVEYQDAPPEYYFDGKEEVIVGGFGDDFESWNI